MEAIKWIVAAAIATITVISGLAVASAVLAFTTVMQLVGVFTAVVFGIAVAIKDNFFDKQD